MKKMLILVLALLLQLPGIAQLKFRAQTGVSYLEHLSLGLGLEFQNKHQIQLLYGSNFLLKPNDFSSYQLEYSCRLNKPIFHGFTPRLGIKGGYSVYTNTYYRWQLLQVVPFVGVSYPIHKKLDLAFDLGTAVSHELSLEHLNYGEFGTYRKYLPELKVGLTYTL